MVARSATCDFGRAIFSPQAKKIVARLFFRRYAKKKNWGSFFYFAGGDFFLGAYLCIMLCNMETTWRLGIGNVTDHRLWRMVNIVLVLIYFSFLPIDLGAAMLAPSNSCPDFGSVGVISSFLFQGIPRYPDTHFFEVREPFKRSLLVDFQAHIRAYIAVVVVVVVVVVVAVAVVVVVVVVAAAVVAVVVVVVVVIVVVVVVAVAVVAVVAVVVVVVVVVIVAILVAVVVA